jgi:hypothetical protein
MMFIWYVGRVNGVLGVTEHEKKQKTRFRVVGRRDQLLPTNCKYKLSITVKLSKLTSNSSSLLRRPLALNLKRTITGTRNELT